MELEFEPIYPVESKAGAARNGLIIAALGAAGIGEAEASATLLIIGSGLTLTGLVMEGVRRIAHHFEV